MKCPTCRTDLGQVTPQEKRVANLLLEACSNQEIAREMGISHRTVKQYMKNLFHKYGILDGIKRVKLAVALYYERYPEKRIG